MEKECQECIGKYVCVSENFFKSSMCRRFHKALESKFTIDNKDSQKCLCTIENITHTHQSGSGRYEGRIIINRACKFHGNCR